MTKLYATMLSFVTPQKDEKGATAVEYGLLVALIAAVIIVAIAALGGEIDNAFDTIVTNIPGAATAD